jgi:hypothetical protein
VCSQGHKISTPPAQPHRDVRDSCCECVHVIATHPSQTQNNFSVSMKCCNLPGNMASKCTCGDVTKRGGEGIRKVMTLEQKINVLHKLESGESVATVRCYNISNILSQLLKLSSSHWGFY